MYVCIREEIQRVRKGEIGIGKDISIKNCMHNANFPATELPTEKDEVEEPDHEYDNEKERNGKETG